MKTRFSRAIVNLAGEPRPKTGRKSQGAHMPTTETIRSELADHVLRARAARRMHDQIDVEIQHDRINRLLDQLTQNTPTGR